MFSMYNKIMLLIYCKYVDLDVILDKYAVNFCHTWNQ